MSHKFKQIRSGFVKGIIPRNVDRRNLTKNAKWRGLLRKVDEVS